MHKRRTLLGDKEGKALPPLALSVGNRVSRFVPNDDTPVCRSAENGVATSPATTLALPLDSVLQSVPPGDQGQMVLAENHRPRDHRKFWRDRGEPT